MYMPNGTKLPRLKTLYRLYQLKVTIVSFPALVRASYSVACFLRTASLFFLVPCDLGLTNCAIGKDLSGFINLTLGFYGLVVQTRSC